MAYRMEYSMETSVVFQYLTELSQVAAWNQNLNLIKDEDLNETEECL